MRGPTEGKAYMPLGVMGTALNTEFQYKVTSPLALSGPMTVKVWLSCDVLTTYSTGNTAGAQLDSSRAILLKGGTTITTAARQDQPTVCTGPTSVRELTYTIDSKDTNYKVGEVLAVRLIFFMGNTPEAAAKNGHYLVGGAARASSISGAGLPGGAPPEPATQRIEETLEGETANVEHAFDEPTSDTYVFNWTTNLTSARIVYNASAGAGNATILVRDGQSKETFNVTVSGDANGTEDVMGSAEGMWQIEVAYDGFEGNLSVMIGAIPPTDTATPTPTNSSVATTPANATGTAKHAEGDSVPSVGIVGVIAGAGLVALARRRIRD